MGLGSVFKKVTNVITAPQQWLKDAWDNVGDKINDVGANISGKKAAERANEAALQAWKMQNDYNTPANQIQRLRDAGLNPNLFYNMGNTGNASSVPDTTHSYDKMKFLDLAMSAVQLKNMLAQGKNLAATAEATRTSTAYRQAVLNSINRYGMPPNMLTGVFSMLEGAGYTPKEAFERGMKLVERFGGLLGFGAGSLWSLFSNPPVPLYHNEHAYDDVKDTISAGKYR